MSSNDFGVAVIPAIAGFLFGKRAKVPAVQKEPVVSVAALPVKFEVNGLTGVAKYLVSMPLVTSVAKYVKKHEMQQVSSVDKYILRQAIAEKNAPPQTGVAKYMAMAEKNAPKQHRTSVDKYLSKLDFAAKQHMALTGVDKYQAEQDLLAKKKWAMETIEKYRAQEELAINAAKESAELARQNEVGGVDKVEEMQAATGIGRYIQAQEAKSKDSLKVTGVAKYVAKKIVLDSQKPPLSRVEKYLRDQDLVTTKKPVLTGVAKYISKQPKVVVLAKKENTKPSGVSKYLLAAATAEKAKPRVSGVAKYLQEQELLNAQRLIEQQELKLIETIPVEDEQVEVCLEGEFIPAKEEEPVDIAEQLNQVTGVDKYLQKQQSVVTPIAISQDTSIALTGVAKYLDKQASVVHSEVDSTEELTGVERYLLKRA